MQASQIPVKFSKTWGSSAGSGYIRTIPAASQIGVTAGAASLTDGFPPLTFLPVGSGGIPPFGQDFNGILNQITAWSQWQNSGGLVTYDSVFSGAVGGYPQGAILASTTAGVVWLCIADNNATNPDAGGSGWISFITTASITSKTIYPTLFGSSSGGGKAASFSFYNGATQVSLNFNGGSTGANGVDTGSMPTSSDFAIYLVQNSAGAFALLGTASCNGPQYNASNMPSGYTSVALAWSGVTSGGNFQQFFQVGAEVDVGDIVVMTDALPTQGTGPTSWTGITLSSIVPANAKRLKGHQGASSGAAGGVAMAVAADSAGFVPTYATVGQVSGSYTAIDIWNPDAVAFELPLLTPQKIWWKTGGGAVATYQIVVNRYSISA